MAMRFLPFDAESPRSAGSREFVQMTLPKRQRPASYCEGNNPKQSPHRETMRIRSMDLSTAYRILGVEKSASLAEIEFARRKLLQVLHPDKHPPPPEQREIFGKMTHDVVEPAELIRRSGSVNWNATGGGVQFNTHSDFIVPNSKVDGFILFPRLRTESTRFLRWFLRGEFRVDTEQTHVRL